MYLAVFVTKVLSCVSFRQDSSLSAIHRKHNYICKNFINRYRLIKYLSCVSFRQGNIFYHTLEPNLHNKTNELF